MNNTYYNTEENFIKTKDNISLLWRKWTPFVPDDMVKGVIVINHGVLEHSKIYEYLATDLLSKNFIVYGYDVRGFGKSSGERGYIKDYRLWIEDLELILSRIVFEDNRNHPIFLLAFSMGSLIALNYAFTHQEKLHGLIVGGIGYDFSLMVDVPTTIAKQLSPFIPQFYIKTLFPTNFIANDTEIISKLYSSPFYISTFTVNYGAEISKALQSVIKNIDKLHIPVLMQYGGNDVVFQNQQKLFNKIGSRDKTIKKYNRLPHHLYKVSKQNRQLVIKDLINWLNSHQIGV